MRASLLAFALLATSACTQSNVQLPPFYDADTQPTVDSGGADASEDVTMTGNDATTEAATDAPVGDASSEAASDGGTGTEAGAEGGTGDSGAGSD
jgi:hypothetical protein